MGRGKKKFDQPFLFVRLISDRKPTQFYLTASFPKQDEADKRDLFEHEQRQLDPLFDEKQMEQKLKRNLGMMIRYKVDRYKDDKEKWQAYQKQISIIKLKHVKTLATDYQ